MAIAKTARNKTTTAKFHSFKTVVKYDHIVPVLHFLKYISATFVQLHQNLRAELGEGAVREAPGKSPVESDFKSDCVLVHSPFNDRNWQDTDPEVRWKHSVNPRRNFNSARVQQFKNHSLHNTVESECRSIPGKYNPQVLNDANENATSFGLTNLRTGTCQKKKRITLTTKTNHESTGSESLA